MGLTHHPHGISSFGVPIIGQDLAWSPYGDVWFVDGVAGGLAASGEGTRESPFTTMNQAFNNVGSGDVIIFKGNIREELSTPVGVFDVTIIGAGRRPRHADAHTGNNGYSAATWKTPATPTAATPLLIVRQQGWRIANILFDGPTDAAAVRVFRDGGAGDLERDGSHVHFIGCKFVAAQNHIEFNGGLSQCVIQGCDFFGSTGFSIIEVVGAGIGTNNHHRILGNFFHDNASHIDVGMNHAAIYGNTFGVFTTTGIDLRTGANNIVWGNYLSGTYSEVGGYFAGTGDEWAGNYNSLAGGVTAADPA